MKKISLNQKGIVIINVLIILILLTSLGLGIAYFTTNSFKFSVKTNDSASALQIAEGGIDRAIWLINYAPSTTWPVSGNTPQSGTTLGTYNIDVSDTGIANTKEITSTGCVPNCTNPKAKRIVSARIQATPNTEGVSFGYAIQAGTGGIEVGGSSIVKGSLYSNGDIDVTGNSATVQDPGNAWAVGEIDDCNSNCIKGTEIEGADSVTLPQINIDQWKTFALAGGTIEGNYSPPSTGNYTNLGPKKINGNFSMSGGNQKVNLLGPLHITGDLNITGGSWKLDDSLGTFGTMVIVDGTISISGGPTFLGNASGSYILFTSLSTETGSSSPAINYSGTGTSDKLALYAYNGSMKMTGSGDIVAMCGQTLYIQGNGEITYNSGLASAQFIGGPGGNWTLQAGSFKRN